jgi:hypothetical protein
MYKFYITIILTISALIAIPILFSLTSESEREKADSLKSLSYQKFTYAENKTNQSEDQTENPINKRDYSAQHMDFQNEEFFYQENRWNSRFNQLSKEEKEYLIKEKGSYLPVTYKDKNPEQAKPEDGLKWLTATQKKTIYANIRKALKTDSNNTIHILKTEQPVRLLKMKIDENLVLHISFSDTFHTIADDEETLMQFSNILRDIPDNPLRGLRIRMETMSLGEYLAKKNK